RAVLRWHDERARCPGLQAPVRPYRARCSNHRAGRHPPAVATAHAHRWSALPLGEAFLTGLRERVVLGVRGSDRRIHVPPAEYGPVTAEELRGLVEVAPTGTVTTWAWNHAPR